MNILFVWCWAVGSVMIHTLYQLSQNQWFPLSITILARSNKFKSELNNNIIYKSIIMDNILDFFQQPKDQHIDRVINTSLPRFNEIIMQRAISSKVNYMDLASDINETHVSKKAFPQSVFASECTKNNISALINCGISPWMTEFCIAYMSRKYHINPKKIEIYLDENFNSLVPLFSWSPSVAITELLTPAIYLKNNIYHTAQPFENTTLSIDKKRKHYIRLTQEELISIQNQYQQLDSVEMFVWWSEIEQIRLLYNLWLLTDPAMKSKLLSQLPDAANRKDISHAFDNNLIDDAGFSFIINLEDNDNKKTIQWIFDFEWFRAVQDSIYKGSTSISYPTGLSAAWILYLWHTHKIVGMHDCLWFAHQLPLDVLEETRSFLNNNHIHISYD